MTKEEQLFCKRLKDLARSAFDKGICTYTDFLNLNELSLFFQIEKDLPPIIKELSGGYMEAERKIICFYNEDSFQKPEYPIQCLQIRPINAKFSDNLTHRDFLGAILNLGIERSKIGDIIIENNVGYIFCERKIANFIVESLVKIKHTNIECIYFDYTLAGVTPHFETLNGTVSSLRLDSVLAVAFHSSRSSLSGLIAGGKVFVNGRLILSNSYMLKEDDIISVRGYGKFIYKETRTKTKKGRFSISLLKYC